MSNAEPQVLRPRKLRVVFVEDNDDDVAVMLIVLRRAGFDPEWSRATSEIELREAIGREHDVILADYYLSGFTGLAALRIVREAGIDTPLIMVAGSIGDERAAECIREGAVDYVLKDRLGRLGAAVGVAIESKRLRSGQEAAESALAAERTLLRTLIDQIPDPICVKDRSSRFLLANAALARLFGVDAPSALLGRSDADYLPPGLVATLRADEAKVLAGEPILNREELIPQPNGAQRVLLTTKLPLRDAQGRITGLVGIGRDITDRKRLQLELAHAQRFESVGQLASGIAHDMNNILAPIMIAAPMLLMAADPAEHRKLIATIEQSAKRGADLVRQLLIFGRGPEVGNEPADVVAVINDLVQMTSETFPKNITIRSDVAPNLWRVRGGAAQVHQILLNLCVNARDAMETGGELSIAAGNLELDERAARGQRDAIPGPYVRLVVRDTGTGIPAGIAEKIFDPFFTTKGAGHGTGLGLSTVLGIVKNQGGLLRFESAVGQGTGFEILLPAQAALNRTAGPNDAAVPRGSNEQVLVVDDEPNIRQVLREALTRHGYRVLVAADGAEATKLFAERGGEIDLVLADIDMPQMDGLTLARMLRRISPRAKVLLSSGMTDARLETRRAELAALGVCHVLAKPFTAMRVLAAVHEALRSGMAA